MNEPVGTSPSSHGEFLSAMGFCYIVATIAFIAHAWHRVLPFRNLPRPGVPTSPK